MAVGDVRPTKVFDVGSAAPPIPFAVRGLHTDGTVWEEKFESAGEAPGGTLRDIARAVTRLPNGDLKYEVDDVLAFFDQMILPSCRARWEALIHDPVRTVRIEHLGEIMAWLAEEVTSRPFERSSALVSGAPSSVAMSTERSPSLPEFPPPPSP